MPSTSVLFFTTILVGVLYQLLRIGRRPSGYPPGPPTIPVLGNLHQMALAATEPHLQFQKWAQEYGPIYSLILGTKVMIVLSKDDAVKALLDKRSAIYSSRPDLYIGGHLSSGGLRMPYGPVWRLQRKVAHNALNIKKSGVYTPYQEVENRQLLFDIMQDSTDLFGHFRRFASSLTTNIVFGFRWKTFDDPRLREFFDIVDDISAINSTGGAAFADFFPILRKLPAALYPIKQKARQHHEHEKKVYRSYYLRAKEAIVNKLLTAKPCTCDDIVEMQQQEGFSDDFATYIASTFFEAGSETTSSELYGFAQAMLLYPEAQRKGQEEVDQTLRWMPATILGAVPHAVTEDDKYMGYHIPADSMVLLNVWAIHRDQSHAINDVSKRDHFSFGAGRRVCPGVHIADHSLYLAMARLLWAFDMKPQIGLDGKEILPVQDDFVQGMTVHPKEFQARITPRFDTRAAFVKRMWEEAEKDLNAEGQFVQSPI
ncbi:putative cytochrome P450 [Pyrenochaeta sp. MPI-SDFR-AT-0127]|nr:putative cytochrome P450 [Pyrenochaeta sp. MPI-SDFR-AT-0127]